MKITEGQIEKGKELMQTLVENAWKDADFKERLIKSPVETMDTFFGNKKDASKEVSFVVEDQTNTSLIYLNIPKKPNLEELELTNEQLEMISGGTNPFYDLGHEVVDGLCWFASQFHSSNR